MSAFLEVKNLRKSYKQHIVLKGIDFQIHEGEFFALLGPNGAGKSTTISILCGLMQKDSGSIMIYGQDIDAHHKDAYQQIGVVFQHHCMDEILNGYDNLFLRCGFYHIPYKQAQLRVRELSSLCHLDDFLYQRVSTLSGGQKRRLDIARALIPKPSLLILDEPTTGLDPISRTHIWDMMQRLRSEQHISILLTTHYLEEASDADTICILYEGKVALYGDVNCICKEHIQDTLYLYGNRLEAIADVLNRRFVKFQRCDDCLKIAITSTQQTLSILQSCALLVQRFEVLHGSLQDVYKTIVKGEGM